MEVRLAGRGLKKEKHEEEEEACRLARFSLEGSCHATRHATRHDLLKVTPIQSYKVSFGANVASWSR